MSCTFAAERAFGPAVSSCRRVFDFTLFFEELFFVLLPSSLLLIGSAVRLTVLVQRPVLGTRSLLYFLKLVRTEPRTESLPLINTQSFSDAIDPYTTDASFLGRRQGLL